MGSHKRSKRYRKRSFHGNIFMRVSNMHNHDTPVSSATSSHDSDPLISKSAKKLNVTPELLTTVQNKEEFDNY